MGQQEIYLVHANFRGGMFCPTENDSFLKKRFKRNVFAQLKKSRIHNFGVYQKKIKDFYDKFCYPGYSSVELVIS